jgi:hypothetical protein
MFDTRRLVPLDDSLGTVQVLASLPNPCLWVIVCYYLTSEASQRQAPAGQKYVERWSIVEAT